ncbi:MAG TPA: flagellar hook capping FlgD N-terminal domain-containing protein [Armatimonadota bacterium]|nr:flagellar hook capping FlgD N-terminal domain-containing protein [Armatimonadota bacterium]
MLVSQVTSTKDVAALTGSSAAQLGGDFMILLVAQLKAQDPMEPMDSSEFLGQLVQLQSLSELTQINASLMGLTGQQPLGQMAGLIGHSIEWVDAGSGERVSGIVSRIEPGAGGSCTLVVGEARVGLDQVVSVG